MLAEGEHLCNSGDEAKCNAEGQLWKLPNAGRDNSRSNDDVDNIAASSWSA